VMVISMVYFMCSGGYFIDITSQPSWVSWVRYTSYWYYSMGLFFEAQVHGFGSSTSFGKELRETVREEYSFSTLPVLSNIAAMFAYGAVFRLLAYYFLCTSKRLKFS